MTNALGERVEFRKSRFNSTDCAKSLDISDENILEEKNLLIFACYFCKQFIIYKSSLIFTYFETLQSY